MNPEEATDMNLHSEKIRLPSLKFTVAENEEEEKSHSSQLTSSTAPKRFPGQPTMSVERMRAYEAKLGSNVDEEEKDAMSQVTSSTVPKRNETRPMSMYSNSSSTGKQYYNVLNNKTMDKIAYESFYMMNNPEEIKIRWTVLRVVGIILIVVSVLQLGVGAKIDNMIVNQQSGAWWAGLITLIGGILAVLSPFHVNLMIATSLVVSPAIVSSIIGGFTDGFLASTYSDLATCTRQENGSFTYYGSQTATYPTNADQCYQDYSVSAPTASDCVCVDTNLKCTSDLQLFHSTDCGMLLHEYPRLLFASMAFCIFLGVLCLVASIISCYNVWHKEEKKRIEKKRSLHRLSTEIITDL